MPRGGARPGSGRPKKGAKSAESAENAGENGKKPAKKAGDVKAAAIASGDPVAYTESIISDESEDIHNSLSVPMTLKKTPCRVVYRGAFSP